VSDQAPAALFDAAKGIEDEKRSIEGSHLLRHSDHSTISQSTGTVVRLMVEEGALLCMIQILRSPVVVFSKTRSAWPVPKKSAAATIGHWIGIVGKLIVETGAPFCMQMLCSPVAVFSQTRSTWPAPRKSAVRGDMPRDWDRGKIDCGDRCTVLHDPDAALASGSVLPNEVHLGGVEDVRRGGDMPRGRDRGKIDGEDSSAVFHDSDTVDKQNLEKVPPPIALISLGYRSRSPGR
jgi:hypothetical protein